MNAAGYVVQDMSELNLFAAKGVVVREIDALGGEMGINADKSQIQIKILNELEQKIQEDGSLVTKEYVKGRENVYTHPAIGEYNKTSQSANNTVATLIKILKELRRDEAGNGEDSDKLFDVLGIK